MKALSIIRHAKAKRPENYATDAERPLTKRGHRDTQNIAALLAGLTPAIDRVISSPALRTRETVETLLTQLPYAKPVFWEEEVYLAQPETLLTILSQVPDEAAHVVLVGHNPGTETLVAGLCAGSPQRLNAHMSTGTLAHLHLEIFQWDQIRWGCAQLRVFLPPKLLRKNS